MIDTKTRNRKFETPKLPDSILNNSILSKEIYNSQANVFIISTPGGYGKTLQGILWTKLCGYSTIWINLDRYDDSISIFYKLLCKALLLSFPNNCTIKKILFDPNFSKNPLESTIEVLLSINDDFEQLDIIFDNMHLITKDEINNSFEEIFCRLPKNIRFIILSRNKPFDKYLNSEIVQIINTKDLIFSANDVMTLYKMNRIDISLFAAEKIIKLTSGWPLAINTMVKDGEVNLAGNSSLEKYIKNEFWNFLDSRTKHLLLISSITEVIDIELCFIITAYTDCEEILDKFYHSTPFLEKNENQMYYFNKLFKKFLNSNLYKSPNINIKSIYGICAKYYEKKSDKKKSMFYWVKSDKFSNLEKFFEKFIRETTIDFLDDDMYFVKLLFPNGIPNKLIDKKPYFSIVAVLYYYCLGDIFNTEKNLDLLSENLHKIAQTTPKYIEYAILVLSMDYRKDIVTQFKEFEFFTKSSITKIDNNLKLPINNFPYLHRSNRDYSVLSKCFKSLSILEKLYSRLLGDDWHVVKNGILTCFLYEENKLLEALKLSNKSVLMLKNIKPVISISFSIYIIHITILSALNKNDESNEFLEVLENYLIASNADYFFCNLNAFKIRKKILKKNIAAGKKWLESSFSNDIYPINAYKMYQHFTTARCLIHLNDYENATILINALLDINKKLKRTIALAESYMLKSLLKWSLNKKSSSVKYLNYSIELMEHYNFSRLFIEEGESILPILKKLKQELSKKSCVRKDLIIFLNKIIIDTFQNSKSTPGIILKNQAIVINLSPQQKLIISLLAKGYENKEIVKITGLTIHTVKSHTSAIYRKLDVHTATEAIYKAKELKLLS